MNDPLLSALGNALIAGHADQALQLEAICYNRLVKPIEDENHYYRMFQIWQSGMERLGERRRGRVAEGDTVGFVLHSDNPMAHTQIVLEHCRLRQSNVKTCVFVLSRGTNHLANLFRPYGVKVSVVCPGPIRTPILQGGRYGRFKASLDLGVLAAAIERLRPVDPAPFARRVLRAVERNRAIIVEPMRWRAFWWLDRLSPWLFEKLAARLYRDLRRDLDATRGRRAPA